MDKKDFIEAMISAYEEIESREEHSHHADPEPSNKVKLNKLDRQDISSFRKKTEHGIGKSVYIDSDNYEFLERFADDNELNISTAINYIVSDYRRRHTIDAE